MFKGLLRFPRNKNSRQEWIQIIREQKREPDWIPTPYCRICSLHFNPAHLIKTSKGMKRIIRGAIPYTRTTCEEELGESKSNQPLMSSVQDINEPNIQDDMNTDQSNETVDREVIDPQVKMDVYHENEATHDNEENNIAANDIQPVPTDLQNNKDGKAKDSKAVPLDKFKRRLVRAVARHIQQKKPEEEMWTELKKEIGCDCKMLWEHMRALTMKKLKRLLPANDLLANIKKIARFTATDWLLFDLILVHEKINVISINDMGNEDENKEEPQCLYDLFELVKEHKVEILSGDDLTEAWIRVTLNYNSRGRQCSPMILQLRWYQLKAQTRACFYNFWCTYRGNYRVLERAMKIKPSKLQTAIAGEYRNVITEKYPEWEVLIENRRVILSEEFTLNREAMKKSEIAREENDVDIEVIEPVVETIELEVDSDEDRGICGEKEFIAENSNIALDDNKGTVPLSDETIVHSNNKLNKISSITSESGDDVLDIDGLSDVEAMHIPLEKSEEKVNAEIRSENYVEEISENSKNEILPKITNVIGNIIEPTMCTKEHELSEIVEERSKNIMKDTLNKTRNDDYPCVDNKNTDMLQSDSDEELNEILHEKANNFMKIKITQIKYECDTINEINAIEKNIQVFEELSCPEEFKQLNDMSCNSKISLLCDSNDTVDKVIQEEANSNISMKACEKKVMVTDEELLSMNENVEENDDQNIIPQNDEVDKKDEISDELTVSVKEEKQDDGFDEIEFDDDQIEFVDDGIEFVDEIEEDKKKYEAKTQSLNDSEDESNKEIDDYPKIDLKLLMNPIVFTKKLDYMDIFQMSDYKFVNDANIIESAIHESKPVDKQAVKAEDIDKFREEAICGFESDSTQSENDIEQTDMENTNIKVKCTSWLLQKPKNRSYNPIQLCKNPDFNTRLKRLTAGFLSSTRNRVLLKECKPLTIDLHKSFEKKLINGTMYLKNGDFKSAKSTSRDSLKNEPVSVLPSVIPGQSMVFTTPITNNISTVESNKTENHTDSLLLSVVAEKYLSSERRKIINLPDIDQVRRVNQSLLTAEVTPIRIDSNINNTNSCKEPIKTSIVEPIFVQPIAIAPIVQVKNEASELDLDVKSNIRTHLEKIPLECSSAKDLMAHKINDQIINLSNQISEVENHGHLNISIEKIEKVNKIQIEPQKKKCGRKPKNNVEKPKGAHAVNKLTHIPRYKGQLSWSPKYPKSYIADSLLTLDTLSKILFLLNGNEDEIKHCSCKQKKCLKDVHNYQNNSQSKKCTSNEVQSIVTKCNNVIKSVPVNDIEEKTKGCNRRGRKKKLKPRLPPVEKNSPVIKKYNGIYCCWSREKIISITRDRTLITKDSSHGCLSYLCQCCCRDELVTLINWKQSVLSKREKKLSKKVSSTIVVSDDEDIDKSTQNNKAIVPINDPKSIGEANKECSNLESNPNTSKVPEQPDKVTIEILIPPIINTAVSASGDSKSDDVQSNKSQEQITTGACILVPNKEIDLLKTQKSCKTVVHAAVGHAYNKRIEPIERNTNEQNYSIALNSSIPIGNNDKESSLKESERTLFLNSSQILNKPTKTPIFLGKNKILLCSLKKPGVTTTPLNSYLPVLPYGVHFVVLPSGELTLSIDNGIQLDSEQLSVLPALMHIVQQQFLKSNISNKVTENNSIPKENHGVSIIDETDLTKHIVTNSSSDNLLETEGRSVHDNTLADMLPNSQNVVIELTSSKLNNSNGGTSLTLNSENKTSTHSTTCSEIANKQSECKNSVEEHCVPEVQKESTNLQTTVENRENISQTTQSSTGSCKVDSSDTYENEKTNPRKTILSDLMEMSGISVEDTGMISDETNFYPCITPLPPTIIPVTRSSGSDIFSPSTNSNVPANISLAGPCSNLLSLEATSPLNHLLNCIAQIRPELNAVTSFVELKYVFENNGQFYKLDLDSGIITEIKVFIKKNPKSQSAAVPKAFIDLTDDTCDSDNEVTCAEFQDVSQEKQGNTEVKPIKLFRAIHPGILKRSGRSLLHDNQVVYPKKLIHVNKHRRKQLLNMGDKYVLVDVPNKNETTKSEDHTSSQLDSSYDSSDEEPLAKKCKRIKATEENVNETTPSFVVTPETRDTVTEQIINTPDVPDVSGECGDTSDLEMNTMDIEGVNPDLHPVAFEEGSESDEDMCILGV